MKAFNQEDLWDESLSVKRATPEEFGLWRPTDWPFSCCRATRAAHIDHAVLTHSEEGVGAATPTCELEVHLLERNFGDFC